MYYILENKIDKEDLFIKEYDSSIKNLSSSIIKGNELNENPIFEMYYENEDKKKTDLLGIASFFVVSSKLKKLLKKFENKFLSFHEVRLVNTKTKTPIDQYYLVNILNNVDGIDYDKSDIKFFEGTSVIEEVRNLVLASKKIGDRQIFRLSKLKTEIIVSEKLKNVIQTSEISGVKFLPVEDYRE